MDTNKILKVSKLPLYIFLICLVICLGCIFGIVIVSEPKKIDNVYDYNELISTYKDEEGMYAEMEFVSMPYEFAIYEDDYSDEYYYMVYDSNGYLYIVNLFKSTANMLIEQYEENSEDFSYHMKGYIFDIDEDCKKLAIDYYNNGEEIVTEENYKDFFGMTYMSEFKEPTDNIFVILISILCISGIICFVCIILLSMFIIKNKKMLKKYNINELEGELQKSSTKSYKKLDLYLTDRYLITKVNGLNIVEHKEIIKVCINRMPYNGLQLIVYLVSGKSFVATQTFNSQNQRDLLYEIANLLKEKNINIDIKDSVAVSLNYNKEL